MSTIIKHCEEIEKQRNKLLANARKCLEIMETDKVHKIGCPVDLHIKATHKLIKECEEKREG
jgi:hypothetical protein